MHFFCTLSSAEKPCDWLWNWVEQNKSKLKTNIYSQSFLHRTRYQYALVYFCAIVMYTIICHFHMTGHAAKLYNCYHCKTVFGNLLISFIVKNVWQSSSVKRTVVVQVLNLITFICLGVFIKHLPFVRDHPGLVESRHTDGWFIVIIGLHLCC